MTKPVSKPNDLKSAPKWIVRFEHRPITGDGSAEKIERVLYDAKTLNPDLTKVTNKTVSPYKAFRLAANFLRANFLRANFQEYKSPEEIIPPGNQKIEGKYYFLWMGFDPKIVAQ
tara:strand:- start:705 stop:1049 length:345 start_codon:yes stop_codon:yes gene_type:complete